MLLRRHIPLPDEELLATCSFSDLQRMRDLTRSTANSCSVIDTTLRVGKYLFGVLAAANVYVAVAAPEERPEAIAAAIGGTVLSVGAYAFHKGFADEELQAEFTAAQFEREIDRRLGIYPELED